jgi:large subunit ribosomal protein L25
MAIDFKLNAQSREQQGKGASRRLRRAAKVPAILYGGDRDPVSIVLSHDELLWNLKHEAFYSKVLSLKLDGRTEKTILRDLQRHPSKSHILHVDLQRIVAHEKIKVNIPLHFINEDDAVGVKLQGGIVSHLLTEVEVECLPDDLPEYIDIDVKELEINDTLHLSDLNIPGGVELVELASGEGHDSVILTINPPQAEEPEVEEEAELGLGEEAGEVEGEEPGSSEE